jgi:hypothetical protein
MAFALFWSDLSSSLQRWKENLISGKAIKLLTLSWQTESERHVQEAQIYARGQRPGVLVLEKRRSTVTAGRPLHAGRSKRLFWGRSG